jgi:hypothetical protein
MIELQVSQELSGVSADTFNSDAEVRISFTESVGEAMGVSNNSVQILGATEGNTTTNSRRVLSLRSSSSSHSQATVRKLNDVKLTVDYAVIVLMQSLGFQDSDEAVDHLKQSIQDSVSIGEFTDLLKSKSANLVNVSAAEVTIKKVVLSYNSMSPTRHPTSSPTSPPTSHSSKKSSSDSKPGLSRGGVIGVTIAVGFVFLILLGLVYYVFTPKSSHTLVVQHEKAGSQDPKHQGVVAVPGQDPEEFMLGMDPDADRGAEDVHFSGSQAMTKLPQHVAHL